VVRLRRAIARVAAVVRDRVLPHACLTLLLCASPVGAGTEAVDPPAPDGAEKLVASDARDGMR
jgi:hypothetical protein